MDILEWILLKNSDRIYECIFKSFHMSYLNLSWGRKQFFETIPLWANATKHTRCSSECITPEMKSFALTEGSVNVGDSQGSSGIQSMTWVHRKLINTANPLDLFQLTVPARTMWDMQLTKASGWLTQSSSCFITGRPWIWVKFNSWHMCFNNLRAVSLIHCRPSFSVL